MRYGHSARAPTLAKMSQAFRSLVLQELYFLHPHPKVVHVLTELEREICVVQRDRKSRLQSIKNLAMCTALFELRAMNSSSAFRVRSAGSDSPKVVDLMLV
jgi:hypothetical protein